MTTMKAATPAGESKSVGICPTRATCGFCKTRNITSISGPEPSAMIYCKIANGTTKTMTIAANGTKFRKYRVTARSKISPNPRGRSSIAGRVLGSLREHPRATVHARPRPDLKRQEEMTAGGERFALQALREALGIESFHVDRVVT